MISSDMMYLAHMLRKASEKGPLWRASQESTKKLRGRRTSVCKLLAIPMGWMVPGLQPLKSREDFTPGPELSGLKTFGQALVDLRGQVRETVQLREIRESGSVLALGDGIARVEGLRNVMAGELVALEATPSGYSGQGQCSVFGIALNLEEDYVGVVILSKVPQGFVLYEGSNVVGTGRLAEVRVGYAHLGRVLDPLGRYIDGGSDGSPELYTYLPIESPSPGIISRRRVNKALQTGVLAIDALIPVGRGQRELIIGDRKTGKSSIVLDCIRSQAVLTRGGFDSVVSVYVAIGQKASSIAAVRQVLIDEGIYASIIFVVAGADSLAASLYVAPYSGTSVGEFFMARGLDVLAVYDDLSKHAAAYREISLLLRRPPGREAYPGDVFFVHARLLERAANVGLGGSLTALPVVETQEGDVSAYIPTNVISITDGQVFLSSELFNAGVLPAIDVGISVSRVGSEAQVGSMKQLTGRLKLVLAQLTELESFSQFSSDLDKRVVRRLESFRRFRELFKQVCGLVYSVASEILVLYVARCGGLDIVPLGFGFRRFLSVLRGLRTRFCSPLLVESALSEAKYLLQLDKDSELLNSDFFVAAVVGNEPKADFDSFPTLKMARLEFDALGVLEDSVGLVRGRISRPHVVLPQNMGGAFSLESLGVRADTFHKANQQPLQVLINSNVRREIAAICSAEVAGGGQDTTRLGPPYQDSSAAFPCGEDYVSFLGPSAQGGYLSTLGAASCPPHPLVEASEKIMLDRPFDFLVKSRCAAFGGACFGCEQGRDLTIGRYRKLSPVSEGEMRSLYHLIVLCMIRALSKKYGERSARSFMLSSSFGGGYCRLVLSEVLSDIHLDRCFCFNSLLVNTIFHHTTECWSS
jgi:F-type H+-transporting ATPase subunit alpha